MKPEGVLPQSNVKQLIKLTKSQPKRINHPCAKYNQLGRITCTVCGIQIKSEIVWNAHVLSKTHKQNEARGVKPIRSANVTVVAASNNAPAKQNVGQKPSSIPSSHKPKSNPTTNDSSCPVKDFKATFGEESETSGAQNTTAQTNNSSLPEGFFDDPYKDAKIRKVPFRDKLDEEMDVFQKEVTKLEKESNKIIEEEGEAMVVRRDLDDIDQQLASWQRIKQLEVKRDELRTKISASSVSQVDQKPIKLESTTGSDVEEENLDDLFDFRHRDSS